MQFIEKVIKVIADYKDIPTDRITSETTFMELGLDSLDIAELILRLEDELDVTVKVSPALISVESLAAQIRIKERI